MRTTTNISFKKLLEVLPRGEPLSTRRLQECGVPTKRSAQLAGTGWLFRLGRGVFMLPGDTLDRDACLALFGEGVPGLHVAGKTALEWRGIRHNLQFKEKLLLWGDNPAKVPAWLNQRFPCRYQATHIFDDTLPLGLGLAPLPNGRPDVLVSTPERALLELLSDTGKNQSLEETSHLVESVRNLRLPLLDELLSHLTRLKVVRLAYMLADDFNLPWKTLAEKHSERMGGGNRWIAVAKTGDRLDLKRQSRK